MSIPYVKPSVLNQLGHRPQDAWLRSGAGPMKDRPRGGACAGLATVEAGRCRGSKATVRGVTREDWQGHGKG